ncbi:MAG: sulfite exporter TauE/SafE family protein [Nocardioides sp.]
MSPGDVALIFAAGLGAGVINAVVGSGTLVTFSTLVALGFPPVVANVSNTVGLVPGSVSAAVGYRRELAGQGRRIVSLAGASVVGGVLGAGLLLALPQRAFAAIVPALIGLGLVLVAFGRPIGARVAARHHRTGGLPETGARWVWPGILGTAIYGGYFGAAQGVLLMAVMGLGVPDTLQRLNGTKNVLAAVVNGVAGAVFVVVAEVDWSVAGIIAVGSVLGAQVGAKYGRLLPDVALRVAILGVGLVALVAFVLR